VSSAVFGNYGTFGLGVERLYEGLVLKVMENSLNFCPEKSGQSDCSA